MYILKDHLEMISKQYMKVACMTLAYIFLCCFAYLKYQNWIWPPFWGNRVTLLKLFVLDFWNDLNEISGMGRQKRKKEKNVRNNKLDVKSTQNGGEFKFGPTQTEQSRGLSLPMSYPCCMPQLFCWLKEGKSFGFYEIQSETVYLPCRKLERNVESLKYFANWIIVV